MPNSENNRPTINEEIEILKNRIAELEKVEKRLIRTESLLVECEKKFHSFVYDSAFGYIQFDLDGRFIYVNKKGEELTGYSIEEAAKLKIQDVLHKDDLERAFHDLARVGSEPNDGPREYRIRTKSGVYRILEINTLPLINEGKMLGFQSTFLDITERKNFENLLRENEKKYRLLAENVFDVIWTVDMNFKFTYISPSIFRLRGYTDVEVMAQTPAQALTPKSFKKAISVFEEELKLEQQGRIERNIDRIVEWEEIHKDGSTVPVEARMTFLRDENRKPIGVLGVSRDISERKKTEKALKEVTESLIGLYEAVFEGILIHDQGIILDINNAMANMFGYERSEVIGTNMFKFAAPESHQLIIERMQTGSEDTYEAIGIKKDGTRIIMEVTARQYSYKGRNARFISVRDITQRKSAEEALRESENLYRTLVETSPDAIVMTDLEANIMTVNRRAEELYGAGKHEFVGKNSFDLIAPEDRKNAIKGLAKTMKEGIAKNVEYKVRRHDGSYVFGETNAALIRDKDGNPKVCIGVTRDISIRRKMEEALRESETLYRNLIETSPDGILLTDLDAKVLMANKRLAEIYGVDDPAKLIGKSALDILSEKERLRALHNMEETVKRGTTRNYEYRLTNAKGNHLVIEVNSSVILDANGVPTAHIAVIRDITEKKKNEEELAKISKLESLGFLAGGIAHDFNNILTGILSNISLAKMYTGSTDKIQTKLTEAEKAVLRAKSLTQQLLVFSKGGAPIKETASISELIKDTAEFVLSGSNVVCNIDVPENLWAVKFDVGQMSQVVNNLIINAKQAMPDGGKLEITARNMLIVAESGLPLKAGKYIQLTFADQGIGIKREHLAKIFDPYFTSKHEGSGLGLAISYSITRNHEGHISCESELGVGTSFYVYLRAVDGESPEKRDAENITAQKGSGRILIMDDEEIIRITVSEILDHLGYDVESAADGEEAFQLFIKARESGKPFDGIIVDLTVPGGMGGKDLTKKILEVDPEAKAIVSSGYSRDPIISNYKNFGFQAVLNKPYKIEELSSILKNMLKKAEG